ncbi:MAG: bis(5'-nucleosyl)-tetraphosphatase (symmetrical) YqeK [Bacillota bacterium]
MKDLEGFIKTRLNQNLYHHCLRTAEYAGTLARRFGVDVEKGSCSALLHDLARGYQDDELLNLARHFDILVDDISRSAPVLLHGPVGAEIARRELGIADHDVLAAIKNHTTGVPYMSRLEMVILVADTAEPARDFPRVERIRLAAERDLADATRQVMVSKVAYLLQRGLRIHPLYVETWNWICDTSVNLR